MFINNKLNFQVRNDITFNLKNIDLIAIEILKDELNTKRNVIILTQGSYRTSTLKFPDFSLTKYDFP